MKWLYGMLILACLTGPMLVSGCTEDKVILVTGDSLVTLADQFVAVAAAMDGALDKHTITDDQYRQWKAFGQKFQQTYPQVVHLWQVASDNHDKTMQTQLTAMVLSMATDIAAYAAIVGVK